MIKLLTEGMEMRSFVLIAAISLLTILAGCSAFSNSSAAKPKILRNTDIAGKYEMYQLEATLTSGGKLSIILNLANGDKVDGYFYVESGDNNIGFQITSGETKIYTSDFKSLSAGKTVSDRFSFTTDQAQAYELTLSNTSDATAKTKSTIFIEVIYPGTGTPFTPLTK